MRMDSFLLWFCVLFLVGCSFGFLAGKMMRAVVCGG